VVERTGNSALAIGAQCNAFYRRLWPERMFGALPADPRQEHTVVRARDGTLAIGG
jgi:hypothetical protein